jgi:hypothetical protein
MTAFFNAASSGFGGGCECVLPSGFNRMGTEQPSPVDNPFGEVLGLENNVNPRTLVIRLPAACAASSDIAPKVDCLPPSPPS